MAVIFNNLQKLSSTLNSAFPKIWGYTDTSVTRATMVAAGFFNDFKGTTELQVDDLFLAKGSDGSSLYKYILDGQADTILVDPLDTTTAPFIYKYCINDSLTFTSTAEVSFGNVIPRGGFVVTGSVVVRDLVVIPSNNILKLFVGGNPTPVGSVNFNNPDTQGAFDSFTTFTGVNAGDLLQWIKPADLDSSTRVFHTAVEILVIEGP